ncbi:hypothetical protein EKK58_01855 [Candidatus Dependentiae bacterium]|nr:MAG: hypothetical protein EKK58_01855 [Candidatus Dependentiae bacterium]
MKQFLFSVIPFASFLLGHLLIWHIQKPKVIDCPSLIGLTLLDAFLKCSECKINIRLTKLITDEQWPQNTILSQYPKEQTPIKEQQTVHVSVSVPPPLQYTPTIVRKTIDEIKQLQEFPNIQICTIANKTAPDNSIFSQSPTPGNVLYNNTIKAYIKKKEEELYIMPCCIGYSLKDVAELFDLYAIPYTCTHTKPDAIIKDQTPIAGTVVSKNTLKMVYFDC